MRRAAFLDRDGVLNRKAREGDYVTRWEEMEFLPGAAAGIRALRAAGYFIVVITNQRCVAKGLIGIQELEALHARMMEAFAAEGAVIDATYYCPHDYDPPCECRKPHPGMILRAARERSIDLATSCMIGDSAHDVEAGKRAGCRTVLISEDAEIGVADIVASSLFEAAEKIVSRTAEERLRHG